MPRAVKLLKSVNTNKDVAKALTNVLFGTPEKNINLKITYPKYIRIKSYIEKFIKSLMLLYNCSFLSHPQFENMKEELGNYIEVLEKDFKKTFEVFNIDEYVVKSKSLEDNDYSKVDSETKAKFARDYTNCKNCYCKNIIMVTCSNLTQYEKYIKTPNVPHADLFLKKAGNLICILGDLNNFNFKRLYNDSYLNTEDKSFLLLLITKLYEIGNDMHNVISEPDIDVDENAETMMNMCRELKKKVPRCNDAFDKIFKSVGVYKQNFSKYHKDYIGSDNNTLISWQNFIIDVASDSDLTPKVKNQFKRIISTLESNQAMEPNSDPIVKEMLKEIHSNMEKLDKCIKDDDKKENENSSDKDEEGGSESKSENPKPDDNKNNDSDSDSSNSDNDNEHKDNE